MFCKKCAISNYGLHKSQAMMRESHLSPQQSAECEKQWRGHVVLHMNRHIFAAGIHDKQTNSSSRSSRDARVGLTFARGTRKGLRAARSEGSTGDSPLCSRNFSSVGSLLGGFGNFACAPITRIRILASHPPQSNPSNDHIAQITT